MYKYLNVYEWGRQNFGDNTAPGTWIYHITMIVILSPAGICTLFVHRNLHAHNRPLVKSILVKTIIVGREVKR